MQLSTFKIYNASAGSGKTFTLAKSYIKILVASKNYDQFKSILAITFTNKAVGEMKERIIAMLKHFSSEEGLREPNDMFKAICEELEISPEYLHNKSRIILKHIIHNYGAFDISTIDGFTHRIIRTFAYDLKLPVNFEVELDQERLLIEAVDSLIAKAGTDDTLTKVLVDFAIEKADDDKSWDISYDFNKISKLLVSENDLSAVNSLKDKTLEDFKHLKTKLINDITGLEKAVVEIAEATLNLIEECGLQFDDFNRKSLPNHFKNLNDKKFNITFGSAWQNQLLDGSTLYPKRVAPDVASTIDSIQPNLAEAFTKTKTLIFELKLKKGFYKNITPLSVLNAIQGELNILKEEQNKMLISEFNKIISEEIKGQPTPFIYERLGEKFKHYFIDEFQDTSKMQWQNLVPLLDNALSGSDGSTMLVGDAKQAIYRWRGGEAEQFINLYNKTENPFNILPEVLSLDNNYRSAKAVIEFNNEFFKFLSSNYFSNNDYAQLYEASNQNIIKDKNGYVNLQFLDIEKDDDSDELYAEETLKTIEKCLENGYALDDISIIVRKGKEGVAIANYLSEKGIKIASSETLLLYNSPVVQFLDAFLKLLLQPENDMLKIKVLSFLAERFNVEDKHSFYTIYYNTDLGLMFKATEALGFSVDKNHLLRLPLYELVEHLVRTFKLQNVSDAYLQFYLDVVLEFTQKQNSDLAAFLDYFEKRKEKLSVIAPENANAVRIMTIHKSKGLEFPIVIFPFAELNIYRELEPKVWFPVNEASYNGFNNLLLNYSKDVEEFGAIGQEIYTEHQAQLELDNINLLYVVLTRAVEQLYIISKKDFDSKGNLKKDSYAGMLIAYLQNIGIWSDNQLEYEFGTLETKTEKTETKNQPESLKLLSIAKETHNLSIVTKAGLLWNTKQEKAIEKGNLVHYILSKIKTTQDIDFAFDDLLISGELNADHISELKDSVSAVVEHQKLNKFFTEDYDVYNERDIITETGELLRPDRININSENDATIIDYKTGEQKESYKSQLNTYAKILETMGFNIASKFLVYINETVEVVEF